MSPREIHGYNITLDSTPLQLRVEAVTLHVATVYLTDLEGVRQPMPRDVTVVNEAGVSLRPHQDDFLIFWADVYVLSVAGVGVARLSNLGRQALKVAEGVVGFTEVWPGTPCGTPRLSCGSSAASCSKELKPDSTYAATGVTAASG